MRCLRRQKRGTAIGRRVEKNGFRTTDSLPGNVEFAARSGGDRRPTHVAVVADGDWRRKRRLTRPAVVRQDDQPIRLKTYPCRINRVPERTARLGVYRDIALIRKLGKIAAADVEHYRDGICKGVPIVCRFINVDA